VKSTHSRSLVNWMMVVLVLLFLSVASMVSLMVLYGGQSWETAARFEATRLSTVEMSELVGTSEYLKGTPNVNHSLLSLLATSFHLPFSNPQQVLLEELPLTQEPPVVAQSSQTRLFSTLSAWESASNKINLGWIPDNTPQASIQLIQESPGVNVICPEWLTLENNGKVSSTVQPSVIGYAHGHKIKVWAMVTNQFSASLTHQVLSNAGYRQQLANSLANTARVNHLDGLNLDFENISSGDEGNFTKFVQLLHQDLAKSDVKLSVDITRDIAFLQDNAAYFHAGLAASCDYVILMAYDEHWAGDAQPGPVADVPWVTEGVNDLLDTGVPADKLILGIPLYARFWHVFPNGQVTSEAVADANIGSVLAGHKATVKWNSQLGVAYARYNQSSGYEEAWYETVDTLNRKLTLVNDDNLAGIALWSLNLSSKQTWSNVMDSLRESLS